MVGRRGKVMVEMRGKVMWGHDGEMRGKVMWGHDGEMRGKVMVGA